jgi:bacillithiol biosynthesis cysteine-adding enzyme BshC
LGADSRNLTQCFAAAHRAAQRHTPPAVLAALRTQNSAASSPARERGLRALEAGGAAAVVTGQQVGLFGGPLFTLFKALGAVAAARALEELTGVPTVPIFWLQTEDHDMDEVDHTFLAVRNQGPLRVGLDRAHPTAGPRVSVEHRLIGPSVADAIENVALALGGEPFAAEVVELLARHYRADKTIVAAFADLVGEVLGPTGLLVFDPRAPEAAPAGLPVLRASVERWSELAALLTARDEALRGAGFEPQVHVRPDSPLAFYHPDGPAGPRFRLTHRGGREFRLLGDGLHVTIDEIIGRAEADPRVLSTSALLRPLLQDSLLPTALYLGGPAEVSYLAQVGPLYGALELQQPLVGLRPRARLLEGYVRSLLARAHATAADVSADIPATVARLSPAEASAHVIAARVLERAVADAYQAAAPQIESGPAGRPFRRARRTVERATASILRRAEVEEASRDAVARARAANLVHALWPLGQPQERVVGFLGAASRAGLERTLESVASAIAPPAGSVVRAEVVDVEI